MGGIQSAAFDQVFNDPPVHRREIDPAAEIEIAIGRRRPARDSPESPPLLFHLHFLLPPDQSALCSHRREIGSALVDIGRKDLYALLSALGKIFDDFVRVAHLRSHQRRHELDWIMAL